jgi:predicted transcriptional regulator
MKVNNKKCIVCGVRYTFCTSCSEFDKEPRWRAIYHDANCKKIFETATDYLAGQLTKEQAKESFDQCDLSNKDNFNATIIKAIDKVYEVEKTTKSMTRRKKQAIKEVVDPVDVVDETIEPDEINNDFNMNGDL